MLFHKNITLEQATRLLRGHMLDVFKGFFSKEPHRHCFDYQLSEDLKKVVAPYHNAAFEMTVNGWMSANTPCIRVRFVPNEALEKEEQDELANLVLLKFRQYLYSWGLDWECFSFFQSGQNYGEILIFYSELPEDTVHYQKRYRVFQRANEPKKVQLLIDESLEKEIKNEH